MVIILIVLLYITKNLYKKDGVTPSLFLVSGYLLSTIVGIIYLIYYSEEIYDYSYFSMIYYIVCLVVFLFPLLKYTGKSIVFSFPKRTTNIISYILIVLGLIALFFEVKDFNLAELMVNWLDARNEYYSDFGEFEVASSLSESIASNVKSLIFMCWPLAMFQLSKGRNKKLAILLIIASCCSLISSLKIAERQGLILYIANALFSYLVFKDEFSEAARRKILIFATVVIGLLVTLIGAITLSRFGEDNDSLISSLANYAGVQPFNAAYFLEELHSQALGGKLNFPFLTGGGMIVLINEVISSSEFLNVFGSIVGSYYLDFGYFTIFVVAIVSCFFLKLMKSFKKKGSLLFFFFYCLYFNIMFVGVFYNKYNSPQIVRNIFLLGILIWGLEIVFKTKKN